MSIPEIVTSLSEVRLHSAGNFLLTLVMVGDFVQFFDLEHKVPRTIGVVIRKKLLEVETMSRAHQHVFPDAAYNCQKIPTNATTFSYSLLPLDRARYEKNRQY